MDFTPAYRDIQNRIRTALPQFDLYDTNVPLDVEKLTVNGKFKPYMVISLGGGIRAARGRGIVSPKYDPMQYWIVITCVAPEDAPAVQLKSTLLDLLTGFVPTDADQLTPEGGQAQSVANENRVPIFYQHRVMFHFYQNMTNQTA